MSQGEGEVIGERTREAIQHLTATGAGVLPAGVYRPRDPGADAATTRLRALVSGDCRGADGRGPSHRAWGALASGDGTAAAASAPGQPQEEGGVMATEDLLTPEDVAKRLKVSPHTVIDYLRKGRLKGIKLAKHWRVREEELQRFLKAHERDGAQEVKQ